MDRPMHRGLGVVLAVALAVFTLLAALGLSPAERPPSSSGARAVWPSALSSSVTSPGTAALLSGAHGSRLATDAVTVPPGALTEPLAPSRGVRIGLTLGFSHPEELSRLLASLEDPASPEYRQFLTYAEFEASYAPPPSSVAAAEAALRSVGASSVVLPAGSTTVEGTVSARGLSELLGVRPVEYASAGGGWGYTALGSPQLPASLQGKVVGIDGLSGVAGPVGAARPGASAPALSPRAGLAPLFVRQAITGTDWYFGSDFAQAYEATQLWPLSNTSVAHATFPKHVAVATLLASSYNESYGVNLPPFVPSVVDRYFNDTFNSGWPLPILKGIPVHENGAADPPPPGPLVQGSVALTDTSGMETENSLDLEMAGSMAPGASLYNFYFADSLLLNANLSSAALYLSDDLASALSYTGYGLSPLAVVSCSFGLPDLNETSWNAQLVLAAAMGVTVVAASGDNGGSPPLWPASVAFNTSGVLSVGGTSVVLSGSATSTYTAPPLVASYDDKVQGIGSMSAWFASTGFGHYLGSQGGVSSVYPEPYWQFHSAAQPAIVSAAITQGVSSLGRAGPDLAFPARDTIAYTNGTGASPFFGIISGTSVAAPVLAGLLADVVAVETNISGSFHPLGYLTPEIYRLASYYAAYPNLTTPFLDVYNGSTSVFSAVPGWDAATGWGGLLAPLFLLADENPPPANYTYTGPTPGLPGRPGPAFPLWTVLLVLAGASTACVVGVVILLDARSRERFGSQEPDIFAAAVLPAGEVTASFPAPAAVFSCPYCGKDRPAEAGPCPSCGVI